MGEKKARIKDIARKYAEELEKLGVPVELIILFGSYARGEAREYSDIDFVVISELFGQEDGLEFSGILSRAKHPLAAELIEAIGLSPKQIKQAPENSFIESIRKTGKVVYKKAA